MTELTRCHACGAILTAEEEATHPKVCIVINEGPWEPTKAELVADAIAKAKQEILSDIREGLVPAGISSFSELHDYCDANVYGGLCEEHGDMSTEDANKVQEALDAWIKSGDAQLCVHCYTPVFWDETALNYRHRQPTEGCPMALEPKPDESKRTILIHLNVEASGSDERSDDEIIDTVLASVEVGLGGAPGSLATGSELEFKDFTYPPLVICLALAEEI